MDTRKFKICLGIVRLSPQVFFVQQVAFSFFCSRSRTIWSFSFLLEASVSLQLNQKMFPKPFHWAMLALNCATIVSNTFSLICVLDTFNTKVTLFRILSLDGIISLMFAFFSAITHGLSAWEFMPEGKVKCSLILMTCMPPYINGILCSLMISVIR